MTQWASGCPPTIMQRELISLLVPSSRCPNGAQAFKSYTWWTYILCTDCEQRTAKLRAESNNLFPIDFPSV